MPVSITQYTARCLDRTCDRRKTCFRYLLKQRVSKRKTPKGVRIEKLYPEPEDTFMWEDGTTRHCFWPTTGRESECRDWKLVDRENSDMSERRKQ